MRELKVGTKPFGETQRRKELLAGEKTTRRTRRRSTSWEKINELNVGSDKIWKKKKYRRENRMGKKERRKEIVEKNH